MEYLNSFKEVKQWKLIRDIDSGRIMYKGDDLGNVYGDKLYFTTINSEEDLMEIFEGTEGNYTIIPRNNTLSEVKPKKEPKKPEETKISFDFDATLDRNHIQEYAKELVDKGYDVWVHTLRMKNLEGGYNKDWNDDLYKVIKEVGIPEERVVFCEMIDKWEFLKGKGFIWHLDDDYQECNLINRLTDCIGVCHYGNSTWKNKCNKSLGYDNIK